MPAQGYIQPVEYSIADHINLADQGFLRGDEDGNYYPPASVNDAAN